MDAAATAAASTTLGVGTVSATNAYFHDSIGGLIVSRCGSETRQIARLAYFWNIAVIARLGTEQRLSDRSFYQTLVQVCAPISSALMSAAYNRGDILQISDVDATAMSFVTLELIKRVQQKEVFARCTDDDNRRLQIVARSSSGRTRRPETNEHRAHAASHRCTPATRRCR